VVAQTNHQITKCNRK